MANQILLNFAIPFTEVTAAATLKIGYLRKAAIVVKQKASGGESVTFAECTDYAAVQALTGNADAKGFFDGGMSQCYVIALPYAEGQEPDLSAIDAVLEANQNKFFTLHLASDLLETAVLAAEINFKGVISSSFTTQENAKTFAANNCAGLSTLETRGYETCYALGKLLSMRTKWGNQQYVEYNGADSIETVSSLGLAESLFNDRITFWLYDEDEGKKLAFFGAGGRAITEKYVSEELKLSMQTDAVNYIAVNQPMNSLEMRVALQNELQAVINGYVDDGYLSADGENSITVTESNEMFFVNGTMNVDHAVPVWRMAITAYKE